MVCWMPVCAPLATSKHQQDLDQLQCKYSHQREKFLFPVFPSTTNLSTIDHIIDLHKFILLLLLYEGESYHPWIVYQIMVEISILCLTKSKHLRYENPPKGLLSQLVKTHSSLVRFAFENCVSVQRRYYTCSAPNVSETIFSNIIPNRALKTHASVKSTKSQNNSLVIRDRPLELKSLTKQCLVNYSVSYWCPND